MPEAPTQQLFADVNALPGVGALLVKLIGPQIGQREVPIITDLVRAGLDKQADSLKFLVLDFGSVTFMNSMGLGMCIDFRNRANKAGGKAIILGANKELGDLFKMVKLDKLYTFVKDTTELGKLIG